MEDYRVIPRLLAVAAAPGAGDVFKTQTIFSARHHAEWLSLMEVSGPFLSMPVLLEVFPDGLDQRADTGEHRARLRMAHQEWLDASEAGPGTRPGTRFDPAIHHAWVRFVLREVLDLDGGWIRDGQRLPASLRVTVAEQAETLAPDLAVVNPAGRAC